MMKDEAIAFKMKEQYALQEVGTDHLIYKYEDDNDHDERTRRICKAMHAFRSSFILMWNCVCM
jgi:hypothetical protein